MRVTADRHACIASGNCLYAAPAIFGQDTDEGLVTLLHADVPADEEENVRYAQRSCPAGAIAVTEGDAP